MRWRSSDTFHVMKLVKFGQTIEVSERWLIRYDQERVVCDKCKIFTSLSNASLLVATKTCHNRKTDVITQNQEFFLQKWTYHSIFQKEGSDKKERACMSICHLSFPYIDAQMTSLFLRNYSAALDFTHESTSRRSPLMIIQSYFFFSIVILFSTYFLFFHCHIFKQWYEF